jgi:hypothetical protein
MIQKQLLDEKNQLALRGYSKNPSVVSGKMSGKTLLLNQCDNVAVIDFDIIEDKENVKKMLLEMIPKENTIIVSTPNGGFHVYCYNDVEESFTKNQYVKIFSTRTYAIDLFVSVAKDKRQLINIPPTKIRPMVDGKAMIKEYKFINNDFNSEFDLIKLSTLLQILKTYNINLDVETKKVYNVESNDDEKEIVNLELIDKLIDKLCECEIHNDATHSINTEISLLPLFSGLNSLINIKGIDEEKINEYYMKIYRLANLTDNADHHFEYKKERFKNRKSNYKCLLSMLKIHNRKGFDELYNKKPYEGINLDALSIELDDEIINTKCTISRKDPFVINDVCNIIYKEDEMKKVIMNLKRTFVTVVVHHICLIKKRINKSVTLILESLNSAKEMFKRLYVNFIKEDGTKFKKTLWDIYQTCPEIYDYKDYTFYSDDPLDFSYFHGYKYKLLKSIDLSKIQLYLNHLKEVIANYNTNVCYEDITDNANYNKLFVYDEGEYNETTNKEEATHYTKYSEDAYYNYLLDWISFILQNPGKQTEVAILLRSKQGTGKNTFTDVLCELLSGYSLSNVTSINDLTGGFNSIIENKKLVICNELKDTEKNTMYTDYDTLKSLWTDREHFIGEKFVAKRQITSFLNGILITNHHFKLEDSDRRYFCLECSDKYIGKIEEYFKPLYESFDEEFYDNLFTFFMTRDISKFVPQLFPETKLRKEYKYMSMDSVAEFVEEHKEELKKNGMIRGEAYKKYKDWCENIGYKHASLKLFVSKIKNKCYEGKRGTGKDMINVWRLK